MIGVLEKRGRRPVMLSNIDQVATPNHLLPHIEGLVYIEMPTNQSEQSRIQMALMPLLMILWGLPIDRY